MAWKGMDGSTRYRFLVWKCNICNDKITSDRGTRWQMNTCKCGKSSVDAEEYYDRYTGDVKFLKHYETEVDGEIVKEYLHTDKWKDLKEVQDE